MLYGSLCPPKWRAIRKVLMLYQAGRLVDTTLFCCCPNRLMFYFSAHLKDLSVTLIRAVVNATQCFLSIQRPLPTPATIYWEKKLLYLKQEPFARPHQLMSLNYLSPESNTFSLCQNSERREAWSSHVHMVI